MHNPTVFTFREPLQKETITVTHTGSVFLRIWCQVFFNRILTNSHLPHNRGHGFRKFKTLQGCPNLAHYKLTIRGVATPRWEGPSILGIPCSRYSDIGKANPARPPGV